MVWGGQHHVRAARCMATLVVIRNAILAAGTHGGRRSAQRGPAAGQSPVPGTPLVVCVWNDQILPADGGHRCKRDRPDVELRRLDAGHLALDDKADAMVPLIRALPERKVAPPCAMGEAPSLDARGAARPDCSCDN